MHQPRLAGAGIMHPSRRTASRVNSPLGYGQNPIRCPRCIPMKNMELDILEAALDGPLKKGTRGGEKLLSKYRNADDEERDARQLTVSIDELVDEGYLRPYFNSDGTRRKTAVDVRGITFKGRRRYRELKYPQLVWTEKNWFPLTIALIAAASPMVTKIIWG